MGLHLMQALKTSYLQSLTDDTGIFQHSKFGIPDRSKGYTTDDNARALIAAVMLYNHDKSPQSLELISTYLAFVYHAQNEDGSFRNFMDYNRNFIEDVGSDDCLGRCIWALGFTVSQDSVPDNLKNTCRYMLNQCLSLVKTLRSPRAQAYTIVGLSYLLENKTKLHYSFPYPPTEIDHEAENFLPKQMIKLNVEDLASRLHLQYMNNKSVDWQWFEDSITYGNAMLPWALFRASRFTGRRDFQEIAKESLDFLTAKTFTEDGYFKPIGSHGWLLRNGQAAPYDEQPIEACEMLLACREAFEALGEVTYITLAMHCYEWYLGRNSLQVSLINAETGGCYDGIHAKGLNMNQGSESVISYSIAHLVVMNYE
jgi:hypothetical protein